MKHIHAGEYWIGIDDSGNRKTEFRIIDSRVIEYKRFVLAIECDPKNRRPKFDNGRAVAKWFSDEDGLCADIEYEVRLFAKHRLESDHVLKG